MENPNPRIWVAAIIRKEKKVLLGQRNATGETWIGTRGFPWGRLEFFEDIIECAKRETLEETGITIKNCQIIGLTNEKYTQEHQHRITIFVISDYDQGEAKILEPDACSALDWFAREDLPTPLALGIDEVIQSWFHPFDNVTNIFPL